MKLETGIVATKGFVVTLVGAGTALLGAVSQWSNADFDPSLLQWVIIATVTVVGGANALSGFISQAFGNWLKERKGNGGGIDISLKAPDSPKP